MSALTLPDPIAAYFAGTPRGSDEVARCFAPHGVVKDKGQTHTGRDAIRAWAGTFAGRPINLKLVFRLERGLIANLEIVP